VSNNIILKRFQVRKRQLRRFKPEKIGSGSTVAAHCAKVEKPVRDCTSSKDARYPKGIGKTVRDNKNSMEMPKYKCSWI
jgi:hypothetical protein